MGSAAAERCPGWDGMAQPGRSPPTGAQRNVFILAATGIFFFLCAFLGVLALCVTPVGGGVRRGGRVLVGRLWGVSMGVSMGAVRPPPGEVPARSRGCGRRGRAGAAGAWWLRAFGMKTGTVGGRGNHDASGERPGARSAPSLLPPPRRSRNGRPRERGVTT